MQTLAHAIYLNMNFIYLFFLPSRFTLISHCFVCFFLCLVRVFLIFLIKITWIFFLALTPNDLRIAHFQLKHIYIHPFEWVFCVSLPIHFKCFPPFEIISKYRFLFSVFIVLFCRYIIPFARYFVNLFYVRVPNEEREKNTIHVNIYYVSQRLISCMLDIRSLLD